MNDMPDDSVVPSPAAVPAPASPAPGSPAPAAPAAAPQLPTSEAAAEMATNMLQSAITQKKAIAESFRAQRKAVLEAVVAQRGANLGSLAPSAQAGATPQAPGTTPKHPGSAPAGAAAERFEAAPIASGAAVQSGPPPNPQTSDPDRGRDGQAQATAPADGDSDAGASPGQAAAGGVEEANASAQTAAEQARAVQSLLNSREFGALLSLLSSASYRVDAFGVASQSVDALKVLVAREVSAQLAARHKDPN